MANDLIEQRAGHFGTMPAPTWNDLKGTNTIECRVLLCPESKGGFSACAIRLPGVVSQGESVEEALANVADAFQAAIELYREAGATIPWADNPIERTKGCFERWILVNA